MNPYTVKKSVTLEDVRKSKEAYKISTNKSFTSNGFHQ